MPRRKLPTLESVLSRPRGVPEMMTVKQVCETLHISRSTLMTRRGIPYSQAYRGGPRLYFAEDVRHFLEMNLITPKLHPPPPRKAGRRS
jgi:hypothetical protein